jgi:hypothetical protein
MRVVQASAIYRTRDAHVARRAGSHRGGERQRTDCGPTVVRQSNAHWRHGDQEAAEYAARGAGRRRRQAAGAMNAGSQRRLRRRHLPQRQRLPAT